MRKRIVEALVCALALLIGAKVAEAKSQWLSSFTSRYPTATELTTCGVCHNNFNNNSSRNPYGQAFAAAGGKNNPAAGFAAIENDDSDGDGTSNLDEIMTGAGFYPGWTCDNLSSATNEPADIADHVDPANPGCLDGTTTSTTTVTSTTSTTVPTLECAQPVSTGVAPVASDCLFILNAAVGTQSCAPDVCVCDPNADGSIRATDALLCLNSAVGIPVTLDCPCGGGNATDGQALYDEQCGFCHAAGAYDPNAEIASNLAGDGTLLVPDLGTIDTAMSGILLTEQEIADLAAFLDGL
jgi:cytochrome c553